jgi:hypothetical protein
VPRSARLKPNARDDPDAEIDKQMFRFNNRATRDNPIDDADRFLLALSPQVANKGLTFAELTGKVSTT